MVGKDQYCISQLPSIFIVWIAGGILELTDVFLLLRAIIRGVITKKELNPEPAPGTI